MTRRRNPLTILLVALVAAGCAGDTPASTSTADTLPTTTVAAAVDAPTTSTPPVPPPTTTTTAPPTTTTTAPPRVVTEQAWTPYADVAGVELRHPSARVEVVAFHQANHDGAIEQVPVAGASRTTVLEPRDGRVTSGRTAADVVVDPDLEVRSVVTGTVLRASRYILYCDDVDEFAVVEPDGRPGWEVKMLHVVGLRVGPGDRVVAGETVIADRPHALPFESQVDEVTADPAWPHVHVEVVDTSIPDRPTPGGGC